MNLVDNGRGECVKELNFFVSGGGRAEKSGELRKVEWAAEEVEGRGSPQNRLTAW